MASVAKFTAKCSSVSDISRSNWGSWSVCTQGSHGDDPVRLGALFFSELRGEIDWSKKKISRILLALTFNSAGGNRQKTLYFYEGTKTTLTGTGSAMKGDYIGAYKTARDAYDSTFAPVFSSTSNKAIFDKLVSWLQTSESPILVLYKDERDADSYSQNYLQITAATLTVEYSSSPIYVYKDSMGGFVNAEPYVYKDGTWVAIEPLVYSETDGRFT